MKFRLLHKTDGPYTPFDWRVEREYATIHELCDDSPETAAWLQRHPDASYLQYDHGNGLHWRFEKVKE